MSSGLIVMTFRHRNEAKTVLKAVWAMRRSPILNMDSVVVATKDRKGKITVRPGQGSDAPREARDTQLLLRLADLMLCAPAKNGIDAITDKGMDSRFVSEISRSMESESSALFVLTRENKIHDADETRSTLALFKGKIHQTTLPSEVEAHL
jgi:uncharacterized membrane protein